MISSMAVNIGKFQHPQLYNYGYDQLNRITGMDVYTGFAGNSWSGLTAIDAYKERVAYDANGNILKYLRHGTKPNSWDKVMDSLNYAYYPNTNRLGRVRDNVGDGTYWNVDIDDQGGGDNYTMRGTRIQHDAFPQVHPCR